MENKEKQIEYVEIVEKGVRAMLDSDKVYVLNNELELLIQSLGYRKLHKDSVIYQDGKIYYNGKHIGYIEFSFYEDIKALGFGNFEIIDKRKGYGTLVIKDIIAKYKDKYDLIYCFVDKENIGAIEFYEKVGKVCFDITNDKGQYQVILYGKEDSVVLSREEYEEYKKVVDGKAIMIENITDLNRLVQFPIEYDSKIFDNIADFGNYVQEQASKETAEKILDLIKTFCPNKKFIEIISHIIAERFGVKIKE